MIWATRGGVVIGLAFLVWQVILWWPGPKAFKKGFGPAAKQVARLLPFVAGWAYGALGILSVAGLIGWAFDTALWIANWLGDAANWLGVGAKAGVTSRGTYVPLTDDGSCMVVLFTVAFCAILKFRPNVADDLKRGAGSGLCLGTSASIAGFAAVPLAQGTNHLGMLTFGYFV